MGTKNDVKKQNMMNYCELFNLGFSKKKVDKLVLLCDEMFSCLFLKLFN